MKKYEERDNPNTCWNKAREDEMLFVLLERDDAFPGTVRYWISERIRLGLNKPGDEKLVRAEAAAKYVEESLQRKGKV